MRDHDSIHEEKYMKIGDEIEVCNDDGEAVVTGRLIALELATEDDAMAWVGLVHRADGRMITVPLSGIDEGTRPRGAVVKLKQPAKPEPRWHRYPDRVPTEAGMSAHKCVLKYHEGVWTDWYAEELESGDVWMPMPKEPTP